MTTEERSLTRPELRRLWKRSLSAPGRRGSVPHPAGDRAGILQLKEAVCLVLSSQLPPKTPQTETHE